MNPAVWQDARARITVAAASIPIQVQWPNEQEAGTARLDPGGPFLDVEIASTVTQPIELGIPQTWREDGQIFLHVMVMDGSGVYAGLNYMDTLSAAFRSATGLPAGLVYHEHNFDMGPGVSDGLYRPMTLSIHYLFDNRLA